MASFWYDKPMKKDPSATKGKLPTLKDVKTLDDYDFLDLGAGDGKSLSSSATKIGGRGLGIELREAKVEKAQELGNEVVLGNALELDKIPGKVDYVVCDNFLEHLPDKKAVSNVLKKATAVTRKFIYISHPSFEDVDYLKNLGLKTYWSDWHGHKSMLTLSEIVDILHDCGIHWAQIYPVYRIKNSNDNRIIPLKAGVDQFHYDHKKHGPKPKPAIKFDRDIYYCYDIVALVPGADSGLPTMHHADRKKLQNHPKIVGWQKQSLAHVAKKKISRVIKHTK